MSGAWSRLRLEPEGCERRRAHPPRRSEACAVKQVGLRYEGKVVETLPNTTFTVELANGAKVTAHISGRMRVNFIKVLPGDRVIVELSTYDPGRGRILYRLS